MFHLFMCSETTFLGKLRIALIAIEFYAIMNRLNMSGQMGLVACLIYTLITRKLDSFMFHPDMDFKICFSWCFEVTSITIITNSFMDKPDMVIKITDARK